MTGHDPRSDSPARATEPRREGLLWPFHPGYILFAVLLYLPASRNTLKAVLFAVAVITLGVEAILGRNRPTLARPLLLWTLFYATVGLLFVLWGVLNDGPGALFSALIYVLWPPVYVYLLSFLNTRIALHRVYRLIVAGAIATGATILNHFLFMIGKLPDWAHIDLGGDVAAVVYEGYTQMASFTLSTLIYAAPFMIATLMTVPKEHLYVRRLWLWVALIASVLGTLLGGRRAGLVTVAIAPLFTLLVVLWLPKRERGHIVGHYVSVTVGGAVALGAAMFLLDRLFGWTIMGQLDHLAAGFEFQYDPAGAERREQFYALIQGWSERPLFGWGFGTFVSSVVRSVDRPWEYELQYVLLLFQTGIVGILLYASGVVWVLFNAMRVIRAGGEAGVQTVPVVVATVMFLVANATNPYFQAYGQLWTIFLPVALLNLCRPWLEAGAPGGVYSTPRARAD